MKKYLNLIIAVGSFIWFWILWSPVVGYIKNYNNLPSEYGWADNNFDVTVLTMTWLMFFVLAFMFGFKAWSDLKKGGM